MRLTANNLKRIILEEMHNVRLNESAIERPVRITPQYLNRIIREEYEAHQQRQRLSEARRLRRRRIAEARRRQSQKYYY